MVTLWLPAFALLRLYEHWLFEMTGAHYQAPRLILYGCTQGGQSHIGQEPFLR